MIDSNATTKQPQKKRKWGRIFITILGVVFCLLVLLLLIVGKIDRYEIINAKNLLKEGRYQLAIKILKEIPKEKKYYKEGQDYMARLQKGYQIFKKARGTWKYKDTDNHVYKIDFGQNNNNVFIHKLDENTWLQKSTKCRECEWLPHVRYIDYTNNRKLQIHRFHMHGYDELIVFK